MKKAKSLVILAGGKGSRISKYLKNMPKPMAKFNNFHFLEYLIKNFSKYDFKKIYILTFYRYKVIHKKFHKKKYNFVEINCVKEKKAMGTGGALYFLKNKIKEDFILINGDTIFDININELIKGLNKNSLGAIALIKKDHLNNSHKLNELSLKEKKIFFKKNGKLINGGIYFFRRKIFKYIKNIPSSLENDILPNLIQKRFIQGKAFDNFFLDIGSPKNFLISSRKLFNYFHRPAVFLDRDGVINYDYGYVHKFKDFKLRKNVKKSLEILMKKNYYVFIVTNQAGIAKGFYKEIDFENLQKKIKTFFSKKGIFFNEVQFAPFHKEGIIKKYKKDSSLRKPGNLMIKNIFKNWHIKKNKSFMIGDKISDKKAAKKSGLYFEYAKNDLFLQIKKLIKN